jgi:hypothetical protein
MRVMRMRMRVRVRMRMRMMVRMTAVCCKANPGH